MRTKFIDIEDVERLRRAMSSDEWLILRISLETGMRVGDIVALKGENIIENKIVYTAQKTGKIAEISINQPLFREISKKIHKNRGRWLFESPYRLGKHITRQCVWQRVKRACARAGVSPVGVAPHSFRKVFAVDLFKREGLAAAQAALQHDRPSTTQIYALSDFTSGSNGLKPLLRRDLPLIIAEVVQALKGLNASPCAL